MTIRCGQHGEREEAIVCRHHVEVRDRAVGFVENSQDPTDLQAWCDDCEELFDREGKSEKFLKFNAFKVVCVDCYASIKARNSRTNEQRELDQASRAEMHARFVAARDTRVLVRVGRSVEPGFVRGYVVDVGDEWVALSVMGDLILFDGFRVFRLEDVSSVEAPAPHATFVDRVLLLRKQTPPRNPGVDLADVAAVLRSASAASPLIAVHREVVDPERYYIGSVESIANDILAMRLISPDGEWLDERKSFGLQDITRVDFGGLYDEALSLVASVE